MKCFLLFKIDKPIYFSIPCSITFSCSLLLHNSCFSLLCLTLQNRPVVRRFLSTGLHAVGWTTNLLLWLLNNVSLLSLRMVCMVSVCRGDGSNRILWRNVWVYIRKDIMGVNKQLRTAVLAWLFSCVCSWLFACCLISELPYGCVAFSPFPANTPIHPHMPLGRYCMSLKVRCILYALGW